MPSSAWNQTLPVVEVDNHRRASLSLLVLHLLVVLALAVGCGGEGADPNATAPTRWVTATADERAEGLHLIALDEMRHDPQAAAEQLLTLATNTGDVARQARALRGIRWLGRSAVPPFHEMSDWLRHEDPDVRLAALEAWFATGGDPAEGMRVIERLITSADRVSRHSAYALLGRSGELTPSAAERLAAAIRRFEPEDGPELERSLGRLGRGLVEPAARMLSEGGLVERERLLLIHALGRSLEYSPEVSALLLRIATDAPLTERLRAIESLALRGMEVADALEIVGEEPLRDLAQSDRKHLREGAMRVIGQLGPAGGPFIEDVVSGLTDDDAGVRMSAASALGALSEYFDVSLDLLGAAVSTEQEDNGILAALAWRRAAARRPVDAIAVIPGVGSGARDATDAWIFATAGNTRIGTEFLEVAGRGDSEDEDSAAMARALFQWRLGKVADTTIEAPRERVSSLLRLLMLDAIRSWSPGMPKASDEPPAPEMARFWQACLVGPAFVGESLEFLPELQKLDRSAAQSSLSAGLRERNRHILPAISPMLVAAPSSTMPSLGQALAANADDARTDADAERQTRTIAMTLAQWPMLGASAESAALAALREGDVGRELRAAVIAAALASGDDTATLSARAIVADATSSGETVQMIARASSHAPRIATALIPELVDALDRRERLDPVPLLVALSRNGDPTAVAMVDLTTVGEMLGAKARAVRYAAAKALSSLGEPGTSMLIDRMSDERPAVRRAAVWGAGQLRVAPIALKLRLAGIQEGDSIAEVRQEASIALAKLGYHSESIERDVVARFEARRFDDASDAAHVIHRWRVARAHASSATSGTGEADLLDGVVYEAAGSHRLDRRLLAQIATPAELREDVERFEVDLVDALQCPSVDVFVEACGVVVRDNVFTDAIGDLLWRGRWDRDEYVRLWSVVALVSVGDAEALRMDPDMPVLLTWATNHPDDRLREAARAASLKRADGGR